MLSLQRPQQAGLSTIWIIAAAAVSFVLWHGSVSPVHCLPAKLETIVTSFPLEQLPPQFAAAASPANAAFQDDTDAYNKRSTVVDSYGNKIQSLKPIETPDGRKVISAQGVQFEIPNYASGITEIKRPADDLLPPFIDPIAVAVQNEDETTAVKISNSMSGTNTGLTAGESATTVDVESADIREVTESDELPTQEQQNSEDVSTNGIPTYLLELADPDIDGPVDYVPSQRTSVLKVIAWDLLPPLENTPNTETVSASAVDNKAATKTTTVYQPTETTTRPSKRQNYRGTVHYTSATSTPLVSRTTTPITTTKTTKAISTPHTTTRVTPRTTTTTTATTTTQAPTTESTYTEPTDTSDFYQLEAGDSYTLPPWLADVDDPDLDVAVSFEVPADLKEYNQTIERDLQAPLEPFVDLKNVQVPEPLETSTKSATTTTKRATSTRIATATPTTTTTTRRPAWVTTSKPAASTSNRFSTDHIAQPPSQTQTSVSVPPTRTQQTTSTPSRTHTQQQDNLPNFNQNLSTSTSDLISNSETQTAKPKPANPFLPTRNNGAYNPQPFIRPTHTDTTTTTTSKPIPSVTESIFDSNTIPPWLSDFDYPDVGPGVPFVYEPSAADTSPFSNLLPPHNNSTQATDNVKAVFVTTSPTSFGGSFPSPQGFAAQPSSTTSFPSTVPPFFRTSASPSKVTQSFPNIKANQNENAVTSPPIVFIPPSGEEDTTTNVQSHVYNNDDRTNANPNTAVNHGQKPSSSSSNQNFAAPFEPSSVRADGVAQAPQETFPQFSAVSSAPTKTTFSKSDNGKVVTNDVFLQATGSQPAARPSGFVSNFASTQQKDSQTSLTSQFFSSTTGGFSSSSNSIQGSSISSGASNGFNKGSTPLTYSGFPNEQQSPAFGAGGVTKVPTYGSDGRGTHYTGNFGGPPGVLGHGHVGYAVRPDGSIRDPDHTFRPPAVGAAAPATTRAPAPPRQHVTPALGSFANQSPVAFSAKRYTGTFGGPPGILVPYDNVKAGKL